MCLWNSWWEGAHSYSGGAGPIPYHEGEGVPLGLRVVAHPAEAPQGLVTTSHPTWLRSLEGQKRQRHEEQLGLRDPIPKYPQVRR